MFNWLVYIYSLPFLTILAACRSVAQPDKGDGKLLQTKVRALYNKRPHDSVLSLSHETTQGQSALQQDRIPITLLSSNYAIPICMGTPVQTFTVMLDTGSHSLFLFDGSSPKQFDVNGRHRFQPSKSSTYKPAGGKYDEQFSRVSGVKGFNGRDVLHIGSFQGPNQEFGLIDDATQEWRWNKYDGIIGMNFASTVYPHLFQDPAHSLFSIKVSQGQGGEMTLGFVDPKDYIGDIIYAPVLRGKGPWSWAVKTTSAKVDGRLYVRPTNLPPCVLPDSGTIPTLLHDKTLLQAIYARIPGAMNTPADGTGEWRVPIGSKYPSIEFEINGVFHQIPTSRQDLPYTHRTDGMSSGLYQYSPGIDCDILGHAFFNSALLVFDVGNARMGVARRPDVKYET